MSGYQFSFVSTVKSLKKKHKNAVTKCGQALQTLEDIESEISLVKKTEWLTQETLAYSKRGDSLKIYDINLTAGKD
jgi:hypothetical protein